MRIPMTDAEMLDAISVALGPAPLRNSCYTCAGRGCAYCGGENGKTEDGRIVQIRAILRSRATNT